MATDSSVHRAYDPPDLVSYEELSKKAMLSTIAADWNLSSRMAVHAGNCNVVKLRDSGGALILNRQIIPNNLPSKTHTDSFFFPLRKCLDRPELVLTWRKGDDSGTYESLHVIAGEASGDCLSSTATQFLLRLFSNTTSSWMAIGYLDCRDTGGKKRDLPLTLDLLDALLGKERWNKILFWNWHIVTVTSMAIQPYKSARRTIEFRDCSFEGVPVMGSYLAGQSAFRKHIVAEQCGWPRDSYHRSSISGWKNWEGMSV